MCQSIPLPLWCGTSRYAIICMTLVHTLDLAKWCWLQTLWSACYLHAWKTHHKKMSTILLMNILRRNVSLQTNFVVVFYAAKFIFVLFLVHVQNFLLFLFQFSADRTVHFGPQAVSSPSITVVLPSSVSSTTPSIVSPVVKSTQQLPAELKREMRTGFRQKVTKACSHHLKDFHKANRISKVSYVTFINSLICHWPHVQI